MWEEDYNTLVPLLDSAAETLAQDQQEEIMNAGVSYRILRAEEREESPGGGAAESCITASVPGAQPSMNN